MTARQVFEATLIELSKVQAPSLKLYEFNYLFNKAINLYINKVYNIYDINQLTTDDLRVLKATAYLLPTKYGDNKAQQLGTLSTINSFSTTHSSIKSLLGATYEVYMPLDYLHILNCVCVYYVAKQKDCWDAGSYIQVPATRLTADSWSQILTDIYNRPSPMRPYYYINNVNSQQHLPTNPTSVENMSGTDINGDYYVEHFDDASISSGPTLKNSDGITIERGLAGSNFQRTFKLNPDLSNETPISLVEKPIASRIGNTSNVRCEIRYGWDDTLFQLKEVQIDYVKVPLHIRLTQELIDLTEDTSQIMEFPDYVNQEIINELVHLVMERTNDPRLGTNILMTLSIARPTQQLQQPAQLS